MSRQWTAAQKAAIDTRDRTLLVSAAAGSGKTAVLTERIIQSILDEKNPGDITRMLIVTFTKAAAAELRTRIANALKEALAARPDNRFLEEQILLLPSAQIRTIDAFCADFLRRYATEAGISPRFRIADQAEGALLATAVMEELLADCYEGVGFRTVAGSFPYNEQDFLLLADSLTEIRAAEATLAASLLELYRKCDGLRMGALTLSSHAADFAQMSSHAYADTPYFALIADDLSEGFSHFAAQYTVGLEAFEATADDKLLRAHGGTYRQELQALMRMKEALASYCYEDARALLLEDVWKSALPKNSGQATDEDKAMQELRKDMRDFISKTASPALAFGQADWQIEAPRLVRALSQLAGLLAAFEVRFAKEKRERNLCEYGDLERLTLRLLTDPAGDGAPSKLALSVQGHYDAVYIDEYQDVNEVQDMIFSRIATDRNAFMVGDIKQSIYGFRGADPSIFSALRHLPPYDPDIYLPRCSMFMQANFRCDRPVIDFSNTVFAALFRVTNSIDYREEDALVCSKLTLPDAQPAKVKLLLTAPEQAKDDMSGKTVNVCPGLEAEAEIIAEEIEALLRKGKRDDGSPIAPRDIAVLLRSMVSDLPGYLTEKLRLRGIPSTTAEDKDFFLNPEVLLMLSLLNVIDNPARDIYLAGVLRSPLFMFTMDELLTVRGAKDREATLYECLLAHAALHPEDEKTAYFLATLEDYRNRAEGMSVSALLRYLYDDTAMTAIAVNEGGHNGRDNLHMLYHYAAAFETTATHGLYAFIRYIDRIIAEKETFSRPRDLDTNVNAVHIMTIHASKGLEFPVCFVSGCNNDFPKGRSGFTYNAALGVPLNLRSHDGYGIAANPLTEAVHIAKRREEREESLRVLYVAFTRARERLILTANAPTFARLPTAAKADKLSRYTLFSSLSYLPLITAALGMSIPAEAAKEPNGTLLLSLPFCEVIRRRAGKSIGELQEAASAPDIAVPQQSIPASEVSLLRRRFDFVYPHEASLSLPGKLSVSRLYPDVLDAANETPLPTLQEEEPPALRPAFMSAKAEADAAARGTATHLFMQFCDLVHLAAAGVDSEIDRLVSLRFISPADAALIRRDEISRFVASPLFAQLTSAKTLHRELRFHADLPAADFTADADKKIALTGDTVFVQGVIDCIAVYEDGAYDLIDYKTDRLPRDEAQAENLLQQRHGLQLSYYAAACTRIFGHPPRHTLIYALAPGKTVKLRTAPVFL